MTTHTLFMTQLVTALGNYDLIAITLVASFVLGGWFALFAIIQRTLYRPPFNDLFLSYYAGQVASVIAVVVIAALTWGMFNHY